MKVLKRTLVLAMFVVLTLIACKSFAQRGLVELTLDGTIGQYPVVMELQVYYGAVPAIWGGSYFYKSQGSKNRIMLSEDLNLDEADGAKPRLEERVNDKVTGVFYVSSWNLDGMKGTWMRTKDNKRYSFTLKTVKSEWIPDSANW
ncbi:MAG: hypothetical protein J6P83_07090 [Bacteroidales bacterium]|nr:hypothetical protein [Bacteroidales bacterium]